MECIFNKTEVIGEDGELQGDNFMELLKTAVKDDEEMIAVMEESYDTCFEKSTDAKAKIADKMKKDPEFAQRITKPKFQSCSPFGAMIMTCINFETFQNCPTSAWNDSEECNAFRKFVTQC
ncbi:general odorant-binding protein 68-like [Rhagoletis pomonella]|uniref:general odorant-binding protein 68-like n=1 Tax=Rhagoletis pomonella TaxID=28610 RepID=UPI00177DBFD2|nr:general odorant-binding protein 68-like [Rhagoletis pomonella]